MVFASFGLGDILNSIIGAIQGISLILVLIGMASAFLYKVAFYVQLVIGLVETLIVTYIVYYVSQFLNLGFFPTIIVFIIGLGYSLYTAARAALMAILNGFVLTSLGVFVFLSSGNPIGFFANMAGNIFVSIMISAVLIGIAAYAGGHMSSIIKSPKQKRPTFRNNKYKEVSVSEPFVSRSTANKSDRKDTFGESSKTYESRLNPPNPRNERGTDRYEGNLQEYRENAQLSQKTVQNKLIDTKSFRSLQTRIVHVDDPTKSKCRICKDEWLIDSEVYKCENCGSNFHRDCINQYVESKHQCPQCQSNAKVCLD